jgi:hypothetical protein
MSLTFTESLGSAPWRLRDNGLERDKKVLERYRDLLLHTIGAAEFAVATSQDQKTGKWRCVLAFSLWTAYGRELHLTTVHKTGKTESSAKQKVMRDALAAVERNYEMMDNSARQSYAKIAIDFHTTN